MQQYAGDAASRVTLLTTRDVAALMKVDKSTVYRMAEDGRLPAIKVGRQWRFPEDRLLEWLGRPEVPAGAIPGRGAGLDHHLGAEAGQALTGLLGDLLGVMVVLTDMTGRPLTEPGNPCGLFTAVHHYPGALERCIANWRQMADEPDLEPRWQATPLGFVCARTLLRAGDHLTGMLLVGGVAPPAWPPSPAEAARLADGLGVPAQEMAAHLDEVHHLPPEEQDRVLRLLPRLGASLSRLVAYMESGGPRAVGEAPPTLQRRSIL